MSSKKTKGKGSDFLKLAKESDKYSKLLTNNPYFFLHWHTSNCGLKPLHKWPKDLATKILKELLTSAHQPRSKEEILEYEFSSLNSLKEVVICFADAFIHIQIKKSGWSSWATKCIRGGKQLAQSLSLKGMMHIGYLSGVEYLSRWINLHILVENNKILADFREDYDGAIEFEELPNKSKALVLAAKSFYLSALQKHIKEVAGGPLEAMRQVIKLDSLVYEWHWHFGNWLRFERKMVDHREQEGPSEEEIRILWETYEVCDYVKVDEEGKNTSLRNMALLRACQGLAEVIKYRALTRTFDYPIKFGDLLFDNEQEAVDCVLDGLKKSIPKDGPGLDMIRAGEILSSILPYQYRNYIEAESYYKRAKLILPNNSKLNHKMGLLYLTSDDLFNMSRTLKHLRRAFLLEEANFPAVIDLIKTLLSSPEDHKNEIERVISNVLSRPYLSLNDKCQVIMYQGCHKFMLGESNEAVQFWIKAQQTNPKGNIFSGIQSSSIRHKWNPRSNAFHEIKTALEIQLEKTLDSSTQATINRLIESINASRSNQMPNFYPQENGNQREYSKSKE